VLIAVGVLLISLVPYVIRRVGEDHQRLVLREPDAPAPEPDAQPA